MMGSTGVGLVACATALLLVAACSGGSGGTAATGAGPSPAASAAQVSAVASAASSAANPSVGADPSDNASGASGTGQASDFCTILPLDRLSAIVGKPVHVSDSDVNASLAGMGCLWETADKTGGVVITHVPVHAGFADIQQTAGQKPLSGFEGDATIGRWPFVTANPDGPFEATQAAAIVGDGYVTVLVAPPPSQDAIVALLHDVIATGR